MHFAGTAQRRPVANVSGELINSEVILHCHDDIMTDVVRLVRSLMSPVWGLYMCVPMAGEDMITRDVAGTYVCYLVYVCIVYVQIFRECNFHSQHVIICES